MTTTTSATVSPAVRDVDGVVLPVAGGWTIDPGHADVAFVGRHFGLTRVRGRFTGITGEVTFGERLEDSGVAVEIDMRSVSSGDQARDDHLRSSDFFDVAHHPTATFRSTGVDVVGATATMHGELTIKGVTRPITLAVEFLGHARDPWGADRAVLSARGTINREDWGLTWNMLLEAGGLLVSKEVKLEIDVELIRS
jgi:polyisoprenoid-binding protein YceI